MISPLSRFFQRGYGRQSFQAMLWLCLHILWKKVVVGQKKTQKHRCLDHLHQSIIVQLIKSTPLGWKWTTSGIGEHDSVTRFAAFAVMPKIQVIWLRMLLQQFLMKYSMPRLLLALHLSWRARVLNLVFFLNPNSHSIMTWRLWHLPLPRRVVCRRDFVCTRGCCWARLTNQWHLVKCSARRSALVLTWIL